MFTGITDVTDFPFACNTKRDTDSRGKTQRERERDPLGSPSAVEGGEVITDVINTLESGLI